MSDDVAEIPAKRRGFRRTKDLSEVVQLSNSVAERDEKILKLEDRIERITSAYGSKVMKLNGEISDLSKKLEEVTSEISYLKDKPINAAVVMYEPSSDPEQQKRADDAERRMITVIDMVSRLGMVNS